MKTFDIFGKTLRCFSHILKIFQCFVKLLRENIPGLQTKQSIITSSTPDSLSSPQMITNLISAHLFLTTNLKDFIFFPEGLITVCWRYINPLSKQTVFTVFTYLSDLGSSAPRTPGWRSPHCRAGWAGPRTCPSCGRRKDRSLVSVVSSALPAGSPAS